MLDNKGFDLWADGYDESVGLSDEDNTYPFAGYKDVLNAIYKEVLESEAKKILDIGFGTGTLTSQLYEKELEVYGQDFSEEMIKIAKEKMPKAKLFAGDFTKGLVDFLRENKYDAIIATYSLHHLTDEEKIPFIKSLISLLNPGGKILIGDVAFENRYALEECKEKSQNYWDDEEFYFVYDELRGDFSGLSFEKYSFCAGVLTLTK
ncbi:class I SAM-dependent methyltransferase [uncultured Anaerococcus sp.]|uniref:class I SAM-dependent methyltransferase n=1 Tax=uncultured Anaerococcus sp. TaxID=293428 RepID=UPI0025D9EC2A|nr:class I SAM-dependent methyltransferase [uncultured Anaerococcus sp.]